MNQITTQYVNENGACYEQYVITDPAAKTALTITPERGGMITGFTLDGDEYIWTRRPNFSECNRPRFGVPVLFPNCGGPDGGVHMFDGKAYPMENHGLADLCAWEQHEHKPVLHLHATGQYGVQLFKDLETEKNFAEGDSLVVKEYINNMPELLAAADLVISRAGALTLAELEAVGRAAVLIPSPNVAENHQYYNAMELQKAGAAVVIEEKDLTGEKLVGTVADLLAQPGKLAEMGRNARSLSVDDSLDRIAAALMKLVQKH